MKTSICATLTSILFLGLADPTEAADKEKPYKATDRAPLTLVILDSTDQATTDAAKELIEAAGGSIGLISTEQVMIGWVPETVHSSLKGKKKIRTFFQEPVDPDTLNLASREARTTVSTFNSMLTTQAFQDCESCPSGGSGGGDWGPLNEGWIAAETAQQEEARRRAVGSPNYTRYFSMQGNVGGSGHSHRKRTGKLRECLHVGPSASRRSQAES